MFHDMTITNCGVSYMIGNALINKKDFGFYMINANLVWSSLQNEVPFHIGTCSMFILLNVY